MKQNRLDVIQDYQRHLRSMELSENTIIDYTRVLNLMDRWLRQEYSVGLSDCDDVKGYMVSMYCSSIQPLKIATRTLYHTVIKAFLSWLHAMQYTSHDLSTAVPKLPSIGRYNSTHRSEVTVKRGYTPEEIKAMLTCPRRTEFVFHRDRAIIITMLATGLRVSELIALKVQDVLSEPEYVHVPRKGTHGQPVPVAIASSAFPYINTYLAIREKRLRELNLPVSPDAPLWISNRGKAFDRRDVLDSLTDLQKKLGIPTGTHTLRHTMITEVTKQANPIVARDAAGQKSISVTNRYLHSTQQEIKAAVDLAGAMIDRALAEDKPISSQKP